MSLIRSPLHDMHLERGGHMVEYAGWEMPLHYGSIVEEHRQVRSSGGFFDVSHMGRVEVKGRHSRKLLERLCTRRISDMQKGQARYSMVCNEQGGVKDDVLVYRMDDDDFLVVCNAANRAKIVSHFGSMRDAWELTAKINDTTEKTAMLAVQGPRVMDLISGFSREIPSLKRYRFAVKNLMVVKLIVSRTGYTGEDGVEVILPSGMVNLALKVLLKDAGLDEAEGIVKPAGLGCRDSLRLEAAMALYGHELGEDINALSCNVDFAINLDKDEDERGEEFVGQAALKKTRDAGGPTRRIVGLQLDSRRAGRQGMRVMAGDREVGTVTSGCLSPALDASIALALVDSAETAVGTALSVDTGKQRLEGEVVPLPFYKAPKPQPSASAS